MSENEKLLLDLRDHVPVLAGDGRMTKVLNALEGLLGIKKMREHAAQLDPLVAEGMLPFDAFAKVAGFSIEEHGVLSRVPESGGVLVIANHPFGGADAIALSALVHRVRADMKVISNAEITRIPALAPHLFPMEIMGQEGAARRNVAMMRHAMKHVNSGGALVMFPSGAVAHWQWDQGMIADPEWSGHAARLLLKTKAPVLPVGFSGRNPGWFQFFGALNPLLRSALIPRALMAQQGRKVACFGGRMRSWDVYSQRAEELTEQLRTWVSEATELTGN